MCRHILSALYNVAERYDEDAIRSVLRELTPRSARIMWASNTHEVRCGPLCNTSPCDAVLIPKCSGLSGP